MISYFVSDEWIEYANKQKRMFGSHNSPKQINGEPNYIGTFGELAFGKLLKEAGLGFNYEARDHKTWDFVIGSAKIDVKTQLAKYAPSPEWFATIASHQKDYECDWYVFCILEEKHGKPYVLHIVSACHKDIFFKHSQCNAHRKGDRVVAMTVSFDCHMLRHKFMLTPEEFIRLIVTMRNNY